MTLSRAAAAGYSALVASLVVGPALVVRSAGERGGAGTVGSTDLLLVSAAVGAVGAALAWRAMSTTEAGDPADRWIAALCALAVLAPGATLLPTVALHLSAGIPGSAGLAPWLWGAALALAGGLAVAAGLRVRRWLGQETAAPGTRHRFGSRAGRTDA